MTWREDLRRVSVGGRTLIGASFRGVGFFVDSSERGGGRRATVHEFPLQDNPFVEDLGRSARTFRIDGYVIGDAYQVQRDALLAALEDESGPGELVSPYHGVRRAICVRMSVRESKADGGMATFSLEFAETPTQAPTPSAVVNAADQVATSAAATNVAGDAEFAKQYSITGMPAFALTSAETALKNGAAALSAKLGPIITVSQEAAALSGQVALITTQASSLIRQPAGVMSSFRSAITGLLDTALAAPGVVMEALFQTYLTDFGPTVIATTATRALELANQIALVAGLRRVIAIEAARLASLVRYASIDDALAARDKVASLLEEQAALASDTAYPSIVALRSQVLNAVPGGSAFASIVTVTRVVPIPSLLLAYQLYGAVDRELDLVARNRVKHPGFVAGDLKALSK